MIEAIDRRLFLKFGTLMATAATGMPVLAKGAAAQDHLQEMAHVPPDAPKVAMLIYPNMVGLDMIGPMTVFKIAQFDVQLVWKDKSPVSNDLGIPLFATQTFEQCASDLDILFVGGGTLGTVACMNDADVLAFLTDRGTRAKWVTSVCTGALVLAAAGLLDGYDATAHWAVADQLPLLGARHVDKRVVRDRNRMTGGGVTAGIDFALALVAQMKGEELARKIQLIIEYAPEPPFKNGTPAEAGAERTEAALSSRAWMDEQVHIATEQAAKRLHSIESTGA